MGKTKLFIFTLFFLSLVFLATACGDQEVTGQVGNQEDVAQVSGNEQGEGLKKLKFVLPRSVELLDDAHLWAAIKMGYFEEEGLEVEVEEAYGTTDVKMVATKNAEFAYPSPNFTLMGIENDLPIKSVFQVDRINIFGMAVKPNSGIKSWEDMKGKTVALADAAWANIINPTLIAAGLDPEKDIEFVVAGENRYQMVQEENLDMLMTWEVEVKELQGKGFDFEFIPGDEVLPYASNTIVTHTDFIEEDPETIEGFARALAKGLYFVKSNPEATADLLLEQFPSIDIPWAGAVGSMEGRIVQSFGYDENKHQEVIDAGLGLHDEDKWKMNVEWALKTDIIKEEIPLDRILTNEFIDTDIDFSKVVEDAESYEVKERD